jgi:hypothetical protein
VSAELRGASELKVGRAGCRLTFVAAPGPPWRSPFIDPVDRGVAHHRLDLEVLGAAVAANGCTASVVTSIPTSDAKQKVHAKGELTGRAGWQRQ